MTDQTPEDPYAAPQPPPYGTSPVPEPPPPYAPAPEQPASPAPVPEPPASPYAPQTPAPYGQAPYGQAPYGQAPYGQAPYGQAPYGQPGYPVTAGYPVGGPGPDTNKRPGTVTTACILTFVFAGLAALGSFAMYAFIQSNNQDLIDAVEQATADADVNMSTSQLIDLLGIVFLVLAVWSLISLGLAVWAMKRSNVGRILLAVSGALAAVVSLFAITSLFSALWLLASLAATVLLFVGGANDWYARRDSHALMAPPQPW